MSAKFPKKLSELLQSGDISRLGAEAAARRSLAAEVRAELPDDDAAHVVSAHVDAAGHLVVSMDSAAWAAKLRYSLETLLGHPVKVRVSVPREP